MTQPFGVPASGARTGPRAAFGTRLLAVLIDFVPLFIINFVLTLTLKQAGNLLSILVGLAYWVYLEGSPSGQTLGKRVMNIRVIDASTGGPVGYGRAALRYVGRIASSIPCLLGYFWMLWDKDKQTWHDKIATTVVVPTSDYPVAAWPG